MYFISILQADLGDQLAVLSLNTKKIAWHSIYSISNWKAGFFRKNVVVHCYTIHMYNKPVCMYSIETSTHTDYICLYIDRSTTFNSFQVTIMMQKHVWGKAFY